MSGFNGATARRPWKQFRMTCYLTVLYLLQWSHGSEAVETSHEDAKDAQRYIRFQWSHGSEAVET